MGKPYNESIYSDTKLMQTYYSNSAKFAMAAVALGVCALAPPLAVLVPVSGAVSLFYFGKMVFNCCTSTEYRTEVDELFDENREFGYLPRQHVRELIIRQRELANDALAPSSHEPDGRGPKPLSAYFDKIVIQPFNDENINDESSYHDSNESDDDQELLSYDEEYEEKYEEGTTSLCGRIYQFAKNEMLR